MAPMVVMVRKTSEGKSWCACFIIRLPANVPWFLIPTLAIKLKWWLISENTGSPSPENKQ